MIEEEILLALHDVIYTDEIPHVNIDTPLDNDSTDENFDETEAVHCTKSIHWKHEDEIRLIMWNHPDTPYSFGTDAVGEVIIGLNEKDENIKKLKNELRRVESKAVIKRAIKSKEKYGLTFEETELKNHVLFGTHNGFSQGVLRTTRTPKPVKRQIVKGCRCAYQHSEYRPGDNAKIKDICDY